MQSCSRDYIRAEYVGKKRRHHLDLTRQNGSDPSTVINMLQLVTRDSTLTDAASSFPALKQSCRRSNPVVMEKGPIIGCIK